MRRDRQGAGNVNLLAGAQSLDITPLKPVALYGYPHVRRILTGVHDPLFATVIVLKTDRSMLVLGALDLLMIEPQFARELRHAAALAAGCEESGVLISCTHTHSGPVTSRLVGWSGDPAVPPPDPAYLDYVKSRLTAAVKDAAASLVPAEIAWATADAAGVGGNRLQDGGVTDPECAVMAVRDASSRKILAAAIIYGMHPTVLHEDSTLVSSDFPHYARLQIQEHVGRPVPVAYHTAPAGNQSPRRFVNAQTFAEAERLGRKLGMVAVRAMKGIPAEKWKNQLELQGYLRQVDLPRNRIRPLAEAEKLFSGCIAHYYKLKSARAPRAEVRTAECAVFGAEGTLALAKASQDGRLEKMLAAYLLSDVQCIRIGDVDLIGLPGECFTEYALEIKRGSPRRAFVISLANGDLQGYIVTPEAASQGGYEAANAVFSAEAGSVLVRTAVDMMRGTGK